MGRGVEPGDGTPLLDLETPLPSSAGEELTREQGILFVVAVVTAAVLTLALVRYPLSLQVGGWIEQAFERTLSLSEPFTPLFVLLMAFVAVAVHEAGHFLAGLVVGFRLHSMRVGPVSLVRESGKWRVTARRNMMDGLTAMEIVRLPRLHQRMFTYVAAGPASSIGVALVALVVLAAAKPGPSWLGLTLASLAFFSLVIAVTNLWPHTTRGMLNDGARLRLLMRAPKRTRRWFAINALLMQAGEGLRPRQWNRRWLRCASELQDNSADALSANWLAFVAWSDENNQARAATHLERCLELIGLAAPDVRELLILEAAIFTAWFRCDARRAGEWLQRLRHPRYVPPLMRIRAEVALDCANRDYDGAMAKWQRGQTLIDQLPQGRLQSSSHSLWSEWLAEIRARQQALSAG